MRQGLSIKVVDVDPDYLGIEIRASNSRYAGSAWIHASLSDLSDFADRIAGFPSNSQDERSYEFGSAGPGYAGGYCSLRLRCIDSVGHARLDIEIEDDVGRHESAMAKLGVSVIAADIDRFVTNLREIERAQSGEAILETSS